MALHWELREEHCSEIKREELLVDPIMLVEIKRRNHALNTICILVDPIMLVCGSPGGGLTLCSLREVCLLHRKVSSDRRTRLHMPLGGQETTWTQIKKKWTDVHGYQSEALC